MEYTQQQKMDFKDRFSAKRRRQLLVVLPIIGVAMALILFSSDEGLAGLSSTTVRVTTSALLLGVAGFAMLNWRCPACSAYLGRGLSPKFCAKCGIELV